ncbi:glutaminyl-peptide cyclotransferase [Streptococcus pyogenes]
MSIMITKGQVRLLRTYSYDSNLYTQGLEQLNNNHILLSAGRYGFSKVGVYDLTQEIFSEKIAFPDTVFAEGLTVVEDYFWLLTYKEGVAYKFDKATCNCLGAYPFEGDGWGLAYDKENQCLWMTSGNAFLQKRDPKDFALLDTVLVAIESVHISMLNELEYVDGYLYANIWQTNTIVKLQPDSGKVVATYDISPLLKALNLDKSHYPDLNVLNGIAHLDQQRFLITGKLYPLMLEVVLD